MASDGEKIVKGRAGKPKVRSGCKTCKRRKVKCDEGKPGCLRCLKFGADCEGYRPTKTEQMVKATKVPAPKNKRALLPNESHQAFRRSSEPLPSQPRRRAAATSRSCQESLDGQQFLQISHLSDHTPVELCEKSVRDATGDKMGSMDPGPESVVEKLKDSITALGKAKTSERSRDSSSLAAVHFKYAFRQYGKALEEIREIASSTDPHHIKLLLHSSVLIFVFESIQDSSQTAITHLKSGYTALVSRDPSLNNLAIAGIIRKIDVKSSLNEILSQLKTLQDRNAVS